MKKIFLVLSLLLVFVTSSYAFNYSQDFQNGLGAEWTPSELPISTNSYFSSFLGRLGNSTATLNLDGLGVGTQEVTLTFDFFAMDSWDGDNIEWGLDYFNISGDYTNSWTVKRSTSNTTATFPYEVSEWGDFGYNDGWTDDIYRDISITFLHSGDNLTLNFFGSGLQSIGDESWGLDNVRVNSSPVPEPATMMLFGIGLLGLAGVARRKQ